MTRLLIAASGTGVISRPSPSQKPWKDGLALVVRQLEMSLPERQLDHGEGGARAVDSKRAAVPVLAIVSVR